MADVPGESTALYNEALPAAAALLREWRSENRPGGRAGGAEEIEGSNPAVLHVALWEPEIPPNTGNVARLCAATGTVLHLIGRLGFRLDDRALRRAGLDYWPHVDLRRHASFADFEASLSGARLFCFSAHAERLYTAAAYQDGDCLLFGSESRGLPPSVLGRCGARCLRIPHLTGHVRSLNLATAVGIGLYEALRQLHNW
jgi:tRNA (cytidine/uridine-2'-O-)-methyltransferase